MASRPWSDIEVEIMTKMLLAGKGHREIAQVLTDRSHGAIRCKAEERGIQQAFNPSIDTEMYSLLMGESLELDSI